jgi:hypothetical protein
MQEDIRHPVIGDNETVTLGRIEPFNLTCDDGYVDPGLLGRLTER